MKKFLLLISITCFLALSSCGTTVYQIKTDCQKASTEDLFKSITTLLLQEGFLIKQNDAKIGFIQAESIPNINFWTGFNETRMWIFQNNGGKVIAYAKVVMTKQNIFGASTGGAEVYYNDKAHQDWTWYWTVRNGLEKICGEKIEIIESKRN